jgi:7-cyano-7-deazaguanine synthase
MNPSIVASPDEATAVLYSGGLDSGILLHVLTASGRPVLPIYVDCGLAWQPAELAAARRFIATLGSPLVAAPLVLALPTADLYGDHWSVSGRGIPDAASPDEAVYLPGRNALLAVKPLVWCALNGVRRLALATLQSNPFPDASRAFFDSFSRSMSIAMAAELEIVEPFADCAKTAVMRKGSGAPLEETLSCIAPRTGPQAGRFIHCGGCNKCAERQKAFAAAGMVDKTVYHRPSGFAATPASPDCPADR